MMNIFYPLLQEIFTPDCSYFICLHMCFEMLVENTNCAFIEVYHTNTIPFLFLDQNLEPTYKGMYKEYCSTQVSYRLM